MRSLLVVIVAVLPGCGLTSFHTANHTTPASPTPPLTTPYATSVQYEMLGWTSAEACSAEDGPIFGNSVTEGGVSHPALYEQAKYLALEGMPEADNLMFIRTHAREDGAQTCLKVTGRGYRILSLASTAAEESDD